MILFLSAPGLAVAQSSPINGPTGGAVHGQTWDMRQDLSSPTSTDGVPLTRTERLRRQAAEAAARDRARQQGQRPPR
ncbi:hypothetical protein ACLF3G_26975 [Falsiroseomonas sp. HC035]|uniref:hypothetical protein n=1 Tax=Falsiroseomonas sp. HC035 TaxID=3390999 RepID=UPI003D31E1F5